VEPEDLRQPLQARLGAALERPVALGEMDLAWLPLPALRVRDVRIGDPSGAELPQADVDEVRLRLAVLPLLVGRVVLAALEIDGPTLRLELDASGLPVLPGLDRQGGRAAPAAFSGEAEPVFAAAGPVFGAAGPAARAHAPLALAVSGIRVSRGRISAGAWTASNINVDGELSPDRRATLRGSADLPGRAELRDVRVALEGLGTDAVAARATGRVALERVESLGNVAPAAQGWSGRADARFEVDLGGGALERLAISLDCEDLVHASSRLRAAGRVSLRAQPGGLLELDATGAELAVGERFRKPRGTRASAVGPLGAELPPRALRELQMTLGTESARLDVDLRGSSPTLRLGPGSVRLEALSPLFGLGPGALSGTAHLESPPEEPRSAWLRGRLRLEQVTLAGAHEPLSVSGPVDVEGSVLSSPGLRLQAGGQAAALRGRYDVARDELVATAEIAGADLQPLVGALVGRDELSGTLSASVELSALDVLGERTVRAGGSGRLAIRDGAVRGLSLTRQALGELGALPALVAQLNGRDLSQYDEGRFELLSADFTLARQRLHTDNLRIVHRAATTELRGWINLLTGQLSMHGEVRLGDDAELELASPAGRRPRVIPIESVAGTLDRPRVRVDSRVLGDLVAAYLADDSVRERIEEKLGPGSADLVDGIIRSLFPSDGSDSGRAP
jgi:hypothetical protein